MSGNPGPCAGVMGWPVGHSLSPPLHRFWLGEWGLNGFYVPLPVRPEHLTMAIDGLRKAGFAGVNLTVPHKQAGFALADTLDDDARACGAVNLLQFADDGRLVGRNTDAFGLEESLRAAGLALDRGVAVLCGAGGAARAGLLALDRLGAAEIRILNRNRSRAQILADGLQRHVGARLAVFSWQDWPAAAAGCDLFVNATAAGLGGGEPLALSLEALPVTAAISDLVYNPLQTDLLARARARGHPVADGLGMLMHQAVPAFEAFYGVRPCVTPALRRHLEAMLPS